MIRTDCSNKPWRVAYIASLRGRVGTVLKIAKKHFGLSRREYRAFRLFYKVIDAPPCWRMKRAYYSAIGFIGYIRPMLAWRELYPPPPQRFFGVVKHFDRFNY